jgi:hypothetical protein
MRFGGQEIHVYEINSLLCGKAASGPGAEAQAGLSKQSPSFLPSFVASLVFAYFEKGLL